MASGGALRLAIIALFVLSISSTAVLASRDYTDFSLAPAPAPMEAGSATPVTLSTLFVSASLLISLAGIIFN